MKRYSFITIFIVANIIMIFLVIYKMNLFTNQSYEQQKLERERNDLIREKEILMQRLYQLKNPSEVKKYANEQLGMKKMSLKQITKVDHA